MSLFDVIRYPIDINFRLEDLERIPSKILTDWWSECVDIRDRMIGDIYHSWMVSCGETAHHMSAFMNNISDTELREAALKALQRRLREYND